MAQSKGLTQRASKFVAGLQFEALPEPVVERAKLAVLDSLGIMLAGARSSGTQLVRRHLRTLGTAGMATAVGAGLRLPAEFSALHNSLAGHIHDFDDVLLTSPSTCINPSVPVLASAIATAEEVGAGGKEVVTAYVAGIELACRLDVAIAVTVGTAAAAASVLDLDVAKTRMALSIAAASGIAGHDGPGTAVSSYQAGLAAQNGVLAAKLAALGVDAAPNALDDAAPKRTKFGASCALVNAGISMRRYPGSPWLQSILDTLILLTRDHDIKTDDVEEVRVTLPAKALAALPHDNPKNKASVQFLIAIALLDRAAGVLQLSDEAVKREDVAAMMRRVKAVRGPVRAGRYSLEVRLKDGRLLHNSKVSRDATWASMTSAEVEQKFRTCAAVVLDDRSIEQAIAAIRRMDTLRDVRELTRAVAGGQRTGQNRGTSVSQPRT